MELGKKVNINIQGNEDTQVDVNILLGKSVQYQDLLDQLKTQERLFALIPETEIEERLTISKKINDLKDLIEQFKRDVLQLAQGFQSIQINTDRLQRAKAYFDKGEFGEARAVFETELEEMQDNHARLLEERKRFESDTLPKLKHNSEEFYILALSTRSDYTNPNRFADTCRYFELSIESEATKDNLFKYAYFLAEHNQFPKADNYYNQYLNQFANELSLEEKAMTLNNLALLHDDQNKYEKASKEYEEALEIRRSLAKDNPQAYLPKVAITLNNLAALHWNQNEYKKALEEIEKALKIYRKLAKDNPQNYLSDVAMTLNNLAVLHWNQNEYEKASKEYEEALEIRRSLAKDNPQAHLSEVGALLNNLAKLHQSQNKYEKALKEYEEALKIYRNLYEQMPNVYVPYLAGVSKNLAAFYQESLPEREKSLEYVTEAIILLRPIVEAVPFTQAYMQGALTVLKRWNLSDEEIEQLIDEKMKETGENQS